MDYICSPLYYTHPVQVKYRFSVHEEWHGGIAFHNYIIGDDGAINIDIAFKQELLDDLIIELGWANISQFVLKGY